MRSGFLSRLSAMLSGWLAIGAAPALAQEALLAGPYPVGATQIQYVDPADGRPLNYLLIYPAAPAANIAPFRVFLSGNLHLGLDAPVVDDGLKHPLVVFSHGAGGNGSGYAWFGEYLASRGYFVVMAYHYRANTFDRSALYVRNRLWQRPRDLALHISHLLQGEDWARHIDADKIGVAGHSQGGFSALWIGGAEINPGLFEAYQRGWKANSSLPAYLREEMQVDAGPARNVRDSRVKAAFAMAPGDIQAFGMDAAGLGRMSIPAYIIVGAGDTTTPPADNAEFAARSIPQAELEILPGAVNHEIFTNECDQIGRDNFPETCVDAPGVDRAELHEHIGAAALKFFDEKLDVRRQRN